MSHLARIPLSRRALVRRGALFAGLAAVLPILSACSGAATPPTAAPTAAPAKPAEQPAQAGGQATPAAAKPATGERKTVTFWGRQQFLPESNAWLTESAKMAGRENGFDVKVELFSNDDHDQKEVVAMEAKQMPDGSMTGLGALWYQNGWGQEVPDLYDEVGKSGGGWFDAPALFSLMQGKRIGVPLNVEPWFIHLRKDVFEKAGIKVPFKTFEEMVDGYKAVTKGDFYGFGGQMTDADWGGNMLCSVFAHGGRLFTKDGKAQFDNEKVLAGFTAYTDWYTKLKIMPPGVIQWDAAGNNKAYLSKQVAAVSNTGSIVLAMRKDDKELLNNTLIQAWPPAKGGAEKPMTTADGWLMMTNKQSQNKAEVALIIKKIMSKERYPGNLEAAGSYWFPALQAYKDIDFFTKDPWNKMIAQDVIPYGIPAFADGGRTPVLDDVSVSAMKDAIQMVGVQGKSPAEAVKFLQEKAKAAEEKFAKK